VARSARLRRFVLDESSGNQEFQRLKPKVMGIPDRGADSCTCGPIDLTRENAATVHDGHDRVWSVFDAEHVNGRQRE
jgi:hypothetical protein